MRCDIEGWQQDFIERLAQEDLPAPQSQHSNLSDTDLFALFHSQVLSRFTDIESRRLQRQGKSFYTIGSAGHEGNAAIAAALRVTDPAFLHYRSGAFFLQRARQLEGSHSLYDLMLSFCASSDDPISGGRHKVLGSLALNIPPQTSTIASHLPKAMGTAYAIGLSKRLKQAGQWPDDAIVLCNFGDASANHSTAVGALNATGWSAYQGMPMPILYVCEDNGIGISTSTPRGWTAQQLQNYPAIRYYYADGANVSETYAVASQAADYIRRTRKPAILHLKTQRFFGHAGADAEIAYRSSESIAQGFETDVLLQTAAQVVERGLCTGSQLSEKAQCWLQRIQRVGAEASTRPRLECAESVMASIVPKTLADDTQPLTSTQQQAVFAFDKRNFKKPQPLGKMINWALHEILARYQNTVVFGEDVGKKGGVYHVTHHLFDHFGANRVVNTLLDEQSILGLAMGMAQQGFLPIPEIQFLAYVHNAEDQIRGEAATLPFFSNGQYHNGMVIRIAGLAYQKGFGGHFHNDNSFAVFRDIPGVIVMCPSNGHDAVLMMRQAVQLAHCQKRLVIFLEPIALYMTRDLLEEGDQGWLHEFPSADAPLPALGEPSRYGDGDELVIITYGNGYYLSRQACSELNLEQRIRILDLRYLVPLDIEKIVEAIGSANHILVVDECRNRGSLSEELITALYEHRRDWQRVDRITAKDSFIPLGSAAYKVLPGKEDIRQYLQEHLGQ
jgi:2-oxoisovalerate dehydrogenase E1 component